MTLKEVKKFDIKSLVKVQTLLMGIFGVILGIVYGFFGTINPETGLPTPGFNFEIFIMTILLYTVMGIVMGFLTGLLYNFIAKKFGGIKIDLK
jgi:ABC-type antimicrobial peptide transport system permease subunit